MILFLLQIACHTAERYTDARTGCHGMKYPVTPGTGSGRGLLARRGRGLLCCYLLKEVKKRSVVNLSSCHDGKLLRLGAGCNPDRGRRRELAR